MRFMCTMAAGFEQIAMDELQSHLPKVKVTELQRGKILFDSDYPLTELYHLRCVDNIYLYLKKINVGPHKKDLERFETDISNISFQKALEYLETNSAPKIIVSASRKGNQTYSRFDLADKAASVLKDKHGFLEGNPKDNNLAIRLDLVDTECMISVQLTKAEFRFRGNEYEFEPGGIRPTIAAALVWLSEPKQDDVFWDPFCGSGTIPRERAAYKCRRIMASDINADVIDHTRHNVPDSVKVFIGDARNLKAADNSIDVIVSNIPWGKQIVVDNILDLYVSFLFEAKRVLTDNGRMIILTDHDEICQASEVVGMDIRKLSTISIHGLLAGVYKITG